MQKLGFIDTWEFKHLKDLTDDRWTWYSPKGNGRRLDYIFVSPELKPLIVSAKHIHDFRKSKLTDHSAVLLELKDNATL